MKRLLCAPLALVLWLVGPTPAAVRPVTILHTNDLHARLSPLDNGHGGFARLATAIRRERAGCTECVLLNAGDMAQGSPVSTLFHGLPVWEIANLFGYDAGTLGNHDFDYGWRQAQKFVETARYPLAMANMVDAGGQLFVKRPYLVLNVNGVRVAVIGAMTDDFTTSLSTPATRGPWRTAPVFETVRKTAAEAARNADLMVLLGHLSDKEELRFLHEAPEIPVLVTGHLHKGIDAPLTDHGRVLVRAKGYGEELGRLELKVDTESKSVVSFNWKRIAIDSRFEPAKDVAVLVKHWEDEVTRRVDRPLGVSSKEFSKSDVKALLERAMQAAMKADFAFMNQGGVRDILPKGQLLVRHAWNIMPFDNVIVAGRFKGSDLPPAIKAKNQVDPNREYTLAVSDFTAANQDAPSQLRSNGLAFPREGPLLRDALIEYIRGQKTLQ